MKVIGLAGKAGAGKDTVAGIICELLHWRRIGFADPLRRIAADLYGLDELDMHDRALKERQLRQWGLSPREILQRLGTEVCRSVHPETWVRYARRQIEADLDSGWVITDCRFDNERQMVNDLDGVVWWIERGTGTIHAHASESSLLPADCDVWIDNTGTLDQLRQRVMRELFGPPPVAMAA